MSPSFSDLNRVLSLHVANTPALLIQLLTALGIDHEPGRYPNTLIVPCPVCKTDTGRITLCWNPTGEPWAVWWHLGDSLCECLAGNPPSLLTLIRYWVNKNDIEQAANTAVFKLARFANWRDYAREIENFCF